MLGAALIHPDRRDVTPLMPEPIIKQDGTEKNDCERHAAKRLIVKLRQDHPHLKLIVTEDSLSSNAPHIHVLHEHHRNRSGSDNLTLAIQSPHSLLCRHGNTTCIPPRGVGTDPIRSASLYSGTGSACGSIGGHGTGITRAQPHVTGAAPPNLAEFFTSPVERSATTRTSTRSSE